MLHPHGVVHGMEMWFPAGMLPQKVIEGLTFQLRIDVRCRICGVQFNRWRVFLPRGRVAQAAEFQRCGHRDVGLISDNDVLLDELGECGLLHTYSFLVDVVKMIDLGNPVKKVEARGEEA